MPQTCKPSYVLRIAGQADSAAVDELRRAAYRTAANFSLVDERALGVDRDPPGSTTMGVWNDEGRLVACVRRTICGTNDCATGVLDFNPTLGPAHLSALALCRGATHPSSRGLGLMPLLCSYSVQAAIDAGARSVVGVQVEGTPHQRAMLALGWALLPVDQAEVSHLQLNGTVGMVLLSAAQFASCLAKGRATYAATWSRMSIATEVVEVALPMA